MSTHGILERSGYFGEAFTERAKQIFNKYYPIEVDPNVDPVTKTAAMSEWWETTHGLMVAEVSALWTPYQRALSLLVQSARMCNVTAMCRCRG